MAGARLNPMLVYQGYKYGFSRVMKDGKESWRCANKNCAASLKTFQEVLVRTNNEHNHPRPDEATLRKQMLNGRLKQKALAQYFDKPGVLISEELNKSGMGQLSKHEMTLLKKNIHRIRAVGRGQACRETETTPAPCPEPNQ
uniref:FLYWCH-type domain-containing protein n=1 Tax=Cacopsylla melanoneura TaxID=428564 RepID=A0A8D8YMV6_9HEMI